MNKNVEVIKQEIQQAIIENFGDGRTPTKHQIMESVLSSLSVLTEHNKILSGGNVKLRVLWESWNDSQKKTWTFCNVDFPEIGETTRKNTHEVNRLNAESYGASMRERGIEDVDYSEAEYQKCPWWAISNPQEIIIADIHIRPVQAIDHITFNFVVNDKAN